MKTRFFKPRSAIFLCFFTLTTLLTAQTAAADTITMAFTISPSDSVTFTYYNLVYTEAFQRLGYDFKYEIYPPARVSAMVNSGEMDGEALRSKNYNEIYTNLVLVDESVFSLTVQAFVVRSDIRIENWESFRDSGYRVEYYRSARLVEQKLQKVVSPENLSAANAHVFALRKLLTGRIDVYVESTASVLPLLHTDEFRDSGIRSEGTLMEVPMYTFLNKKHAELAKKLSSVLSQMKDEGLLEQYRQQAVQIFAENDRDSIF